MTSIVLTADENYLRYIPSLFSQLSLYGRRADGVTLAVPAGMAEHHLTPLEAAASIHSIALTIAPVPEREHDQVTRFTPLRDGQHLSHFTYIRLLLPDLLPDLDDVLYLDVDTMVRAPIDQLLEWDLRFPLGAVPELAGTAAHLFGTPRAPYFNAGVLRMSLERMRCERSWERSLQILETRAEVRWFDQDVLNLAFQDRFDNLPLTYNVSDMVVRQHPSLTVLDDPVIVHFNGPVKPWHRSATSPYAREWRRHYLDAGAVSDALPALSGKPGASREARSRHFTGYRQARKNGHSQLSSLARAVLPASTRQAAKGAATEVVDRTLSRLDEIRAGLHSPILCEAGSPVRGVGARPALSVSRGEDDADYGLDLLVSIARSGTNALGEVIQRSRPDVRWMNEIYLGAEWGNVGDDEIVARFPWFANGGLEAINDVPTASRKKAFDSFAGTVSDNVVALTHAILENRSGRTLIKVFPDQLHPAAFEELLRVFRPRLLVLRRELVFAYISRLRAIQLDEHDQRFGKAWLDADLTDVPYAIDERGALQYALRCDYWFDRLDQLAGTFGLTNLWLTYTGLFVTGAEVPLLEAFYPGPSMPTVTGSRGLESSVTIQDRRSDTSVLHMIKAVSNLSASTQAHLLRLPGHYPNRP